MEKIRTSESDNNDVRHIKEYVSLIAAIIIMLIVAALWAAGGFPN